VRGIVDQNVDPPELFLGLFDNGATMLGTLYIPGNQHRLAAGLLDPALRFLGVLMLIQIRN
jgi:hypothetical protein